MTALLAPAARFASALVWSMALAAQEQAQFPATDQWFRQWLAAEQGLTADRLPRRLLDDAVKELLTKEATSLPWLAKQLQDCGAGSPQRKGFELLVTNTVIEFMRQKRASGITFAGQYEGLRVLQPFAGELLFNLLTDTPQWYPHTHRVRLVRPLRDVHPLAPSETHMARAVALVESSIEPEDLRRAVACLLWQWGNRRPARERLDALRRESAEGDAEDRVRVLTSLADLQYELLDYRASAATHRSIQALASSSNIVLKPITLYSSACVHALSGDIDRGIDSLDQCATQLASPHLDASLELERSLWENDPEIAVLRRDPRFPALFQRAFGAAASPTEPARR